MKLPVAVRWSPAITRLPTGTYAVSGGVWIPVPDSTTREDLTKYFTWEPLSAPAASTPTHRWTVQGSKGQTYTVQEFGGSWRCTCPGYQYRRKCRHITEKQA
jgi:hypothetical protein